MGTVGNDDLVGTPDSDVIAGLGGNDLIQGGGGNDTICGGAGNDQLFGMAGQDVLRGQGGADSLFGHGGGGVDDSAVDTLVGGSGPDSIDYSQCLDFSRLCPETDGGDDLMAGGPGSDRIAACDDGQRAIRGGRGLDGAVFCSAVTADLGKRVARFDSGAELRLIGIEDLFGAAWETDTLVGDDGPNFIYTGFDGDRRRGVPDRVMGAGGDDSFVFGDQDSVIGGAGRDRFFHGIPSDDRAFASLNGGGGADRFLLCFGATPSQPVDGGDYVVSGDGGFDTLEFGLAASADLRLGTAVCSDFTAAVRGIEALRGGAFDDDLRGDDADNQISGGRGDDVLEGRGGHDVLNGGDGVDDCTSGERVKNCEPASGARRI